MTKSNFLILKANRIQAIHRLYRSIQLICQPNFVFAALYRHRWPLWTSCVSLSQLLLCWKSKKFRLHTHPVRIWDGKANVHNIFLPISFIFPLRFIRFWVIWTYSQVEFLAKESSSRCFWKMISYCMGNHRIRSFRVKQIVTCSPVKWHIQSKCRCCLATFKEA